jgi:hypothetical protein
MQPPQAARARAGAAPANPATHEQGGDDQVGGGEHRLPADEVAQQPVSGGALARCRGRRGTHGCRSPPAGPARAAAPAARHARLIVQPKDEVKTSRRPEAALVAPAPARCVADREAEEARLPGLPRPMRRG